MVGKHNYNLTLYYDDPTLLKYANGTKIVTSFSNRIDRSYKDITVRQLHYIVWILYRRM